MLFTRVSLAALLAAVIGQPAVAGPNSGIIQFEGEVLASTCTVSVNGVEAPNAATVILQDAKREEIAAYLKAHGADFSIELSDCSGLGGVTRVQATFNAANGTTVTDGALDNMATANAARDVKLRLLRHTNQGGYTSIVQVGDDDFANMNMFNIKNGAASLPYTIQYYMPIRSWNSIIEGNVEAAVEFVLHYI